MNRTLRAAALALCAAVAGACTTPAVVNNTNNFDRATDVDFLCLSGASRTTPGRVLPLSACGISASDNSATTPGVHLYALVTQAERGELAVVNLSASAGTSLQDNSPGVPGYSFIPVGALPSALVTDVRPTGTPSSVWIASARDRTLERLDAAAVLTDPRAPGNTALGRASVRLPMDAAPRDLAIDTVSGRTLLYATLPERGALAVYDVTDPLRPQNMGLVAVSAPAPLDGGAPDASTSVPGHPQSLTVDADSHRVYVSDDQSNFVHVLEGSPLRETARLDLGAPTRALALTAWARRVSCPAEAADPDHYARARYLYATHAATGAVLVYDVTRRARVQPGLLPAPNVERRLLDPALTPERVALPVPAVALVPIQSSDYRGLDANGEVIVPAPCASNLGCRGRGAADPTQLHGVFVAAVLRDGRVSVIDVDDYDAPARAVTDTTGSTPTAWRFIRHAPRAAVRLAEGPKLAAAPALTALVRETTRTPVAESPNNPVIGCVAERLPDSVQRCAAPGFGVELAPRPAVSDDYNPSRPTVDAGDPDAVARTEPRCDDTDASVDAMTDAMADATTDAMTDVVDAAADATPDARADATPDVVVDAAPRTLQPDPYAVRNEAWALTWEGTLPGLDVSGGAFVVDGDRLVVEAPGAGFCARGAFASDEYGRDLVSVLGDTSALPADRELCTQAFGTAAQRARRDFVVEEAWQDRLVLRTANTGVTPDLVRRCFPQATRFEVRAGGSWVVVGSRNGYQTAVRAGDGGRCVLDEARQTATETLAQRCLLERAPLARRTARRCLAGRACMGAPDRMTGVVSATRTPVFANSFFCFQVYAAAEGTPGSYAGRVPSRDTQITFATTGAWEPLNLLAGTFPVSARYVPTVERFYVVDTQQSGLVEFRTTPFARGRIFN